MFWGCIALNKMGPLTEVKQTMNIRSYISDILETYCDSSCTRFPRDDPERNLHARQRPMSYRQDSEELVWEKENEGCSCPSPPNLQT